MSERFEVPESVLDGSRTDLAIEIPSLVRQEVERALREELGLNDSTAYSDPWGKKMAWIRVNTYLNARFGPEEGPTSPTMDGISRGGPLVLKHSETFLTAKAYLATREGT